MPKTSLGIQRIHAEAVALRVRKTWKGRVVDEVVRVDLSAPPAEAGSPAPSRFPAAETVVAALPSDQVFRREVEVPFSDARRVEQAAPLEAEESLPIALENLVYDVHPLEKVDGRSRVLVAAAPLEKVAHLVSELKGLGLEPGAVDVEALALANVAQLCLPESGTTLLVDLSAQLCQCVLLEGGKPTSFHAFSARGAGPDLLEELALYLSRWDEEEGPEAIYLSGPEALIADPESWGEAAGRPVRQLPFPSRDLQIGASVQISWPVWAIPLGLALRGLGAKTPSRVNLLRGSLVPTRGFLSPRAVAIAAGVAAAVLLALWGAGTWAEISFKETQYRTLQDAIRETFRATVPDASGTGREVDQLRSLVAELEERDRTLAHLADRELAPLRVLKDLSAKVPKDIEVEFRDLSLEDGKLRIEGATTSYEATERIKTAVMASSPRFTAASSEAKDGTKPGEILFKLTVTVGEKR
ncbi:MAG: pilus assembly protein PilM [Deltaproteobacteria bacterium]|nr:pilus assembly protein PilM [Deltaproteobacteria bacterium]